MQGRWYNGALNRRWFGDAVRMSIVPRDQWRSCYGVGKDCFDGLSGRRGFWKGLLVYCFPVCYCYFAHLVDFI